MRRKQQNIDAINEWYDGRMYTSLARRFYAGSDFHNYGYRQSDQETQATACTNLLEQLLSFIGIGRGAILDVACGKGASTRHLSEVGHFSTIVGINISTRQIRTCRTNAPRAHFAIMDATELGFRNECFDTVLCLEAAMHFNTRKTFLFEAYRVLRPGGRLILSDTLRRQRTPVGDLLIPAENHVKDHAEYTRLLSSSGFEEIQLRDTTVACWKAFYKHAVRHFLQELRDGKLSQDTCSRALAKLHQKDKEIQSYILVCAVKPCCPKPEVRTQAPLSQEGPLR